MRLIIACLFICASWNLQAQKRFDCTIYLKEWMQSQKIVGQLTSVSDSGVIVRNSNGDNSISWKDFYRIRFRKHNGFSRTALPLILAESAAITGAFEINKSTFIPPPRTSITTIAINAVVSAIPGIIIYFATRSKSFKINANQDFKNFKLHSLKYVTRR